MPAKKLSPLKKKGLIAPEVLSKEAEHVAMLLKAGAREVKSPGQAENTIWDGPQAPDFSAVRRAARPDPVAARHAKRRQLFGLPDQPVTEHQALTAVTAQLAALLMQIVWGHHGPTRMQLLLAVGALEQALPHCTPDHNLPVVPGPDWAQGLRDKIDPPRSKK